MQVQGSLVSLTFSSGGTAVFFRQRTGSRLCLNPKHKNAAKSARELSSGSHIASSRLAARASGKSDRSTAADDTSGARHSGIQAQQSPEQPSTSAEPTMIQPNGPSSGSDAEGCSPSSSILAQQYPIVSEGRRSSSWQYKQSADKRSLWGTFIKGVALLVLGMAASLSKLKEFLGRSVQVLRELTYPSPGAILRLTCAVLLSSAALTLIVWALDRGFATVLPPPAARNLAGTG